MASGTAEKPEKPSMPAAPPKFSFKMPVFPGKAPPIAGLAGASPLAKLAGAAGASPPASPASSAPPGMPAVDSPGSPGSPAAAREGSAPAKPKFDFAGALASMPKFSMPNFAMPKKPPDLSGLLHRASMARASTLELGKGGGASSSGLPASPLADRLSKIVGKDMKLENLLALGKASGKATGFKPGVLAGYLMDKQAVVLEFGHKFTKAGFASEHRPRCIVPTPSLLRTKRRVSESLAVQATLPEMVEVLDAFINTIFYHHLSVNSKDRRVIVLDPIAFVVPFRDALAYVLFRRFSVPSVSFPMEHSLPLYLSGLSSGVVIDAGFACARVLATCAGVPLPRSYRTAQAGGRHVNFLLQRSLRDAGIREAWLDDDVAIEDLKSAVCYVRCSFPAANGRDAVELKTDKNASFRGTIVPAECRWRPFEAFFASDEALADEAANDDAAAEPGDCGGIPQAFCSCLMDLEIDTRALVAQNVLVVGGSAMLPGFYPRLALEIERELLKHPKLKAMASRVLFTPLDFPPVLATWIGGAVYGALEGIAEYTLEDFERQKPLPDWAWGAF